LLERLFLDHPRTVDESDGAHFLAASCFGVSMIVGGLACLVHAVVPGLCTSTGSRVIRQLHDQMIVNRSRHARSE